MSANPTFLVRVASAPFEVEYGQRKGCPACSDIEPILTIRPSMFSRIIIFAASWIRKKGARVLTAIILLNKSGFVSSIFPRSVRPAELTSMSTRPKIVSVSAIMRCTSSIFSRSAVIILAWIP